MPYTPSWFITDGTEATLFEHAPGIGTIWVVPLPRMVVKDPITGERCCIRGMYDHWLTVRPEGDMRWSTRYHVHFPLAVDETTIREWLYRGERGHVQEEEVEEEVPEEDLVAEWDA